MKLIIALFRFLIADIWRRIETFAKTPE